jgi:hypothetical protein
MTERMLTPPNTPNIRIDPENVPLSDTSDESEAFSACLLVMDDNHRLVEWLAYHFHVLKLRTLIVTTDPRSRTSPSAIFDRWRAHGMNIIEWNESNLKIQVGTSNKSYTPTQQHRFRQKIFLAQCMRELQALNQTWTALWDTDEYIVWNHKAYSNIQLENMNQTVLIPSIMEQNGLLTFLKQHALSSDQLRVPCITIPRVLFGAVESPKSNVQQRVPLIINATHLDTLRWRKHAQRDDPIANSFAKTMIDVSRVDLTHVQWVWNPHRPLQEDCDFAQLDDRLSLLRINHYLGSWESYSARDDARKNTQRSTESWEFKTTQATEESDDNIRDWIGGFVKTQGDNKAMELLEGAGYIPDRVGDNEQNRMEWHSLLADKIVASEQPPESQPGRRKFYDFLKNKGEHEGRGGEELAP